MNWLKWYACGTTFSHQINAQWTMFKVCYSIVYILSWASLLWKIQNFGSSSLFRGLASSLPFSLSSKCRVWVDLEVWLIRPNCAWSHAVRIASARTSTGSAVMSSILKFWITEFIIASERRCSERPAANSKCDLLKSSTKIHRKPLKIQSRIPANFRRTKKNRAVRVNELASGVQSLEGF